MTDVNRKLRAQQTRARVAEAAARLFAARGYQGTPMDAIAAEAGVAVQTVYFAFRTKPELLIAAYDQAVLGSLDAPHPHQQDWYLRVLAEAEHDPTQALGHFIDGCMGILGRTAALQPVMVTSPDDEVRRAFQDRQQGRHRAYGQVVQALARHDGIHPDLDEHKATDLLYAVLSPELHGLLCTFSGWAPQDFKHWALSTLQSQLLHPRHQAAPQHPTADEEHHTHARTTTHPEPPTSNIGNTYRSDDDPKPAPAEPTTSDKPPSSNEHHEVRLED